MTLVALWVRAINNTRELWVASDSRLTGGMTWDAAQKLFPLPRRDSALAFAGDTAYAYPVLTQVISYITSYDKAVSRALDLQELNGHIGRLTDGMIDSIRDWADGEVRCEILLGGYDWRSSAFRVTTLSRNREGRHVFLPVESLKEVPVRGDGAVDAFHFAGTSEAVDEASARTRELLKRRGNNAIDQEPFEVLEDIVGNDRYRDVGGPVQLLKIYQHSNVLPLNVLWKGKITLLGRELLAYERNKYLVYDPKTHKAVPWWKWAGIQGGDVPARETES